jgi:4-amino-4-deoxy-L-arabinose transferase-like glycosyltransferase
LPRGISVVKNKRVTKTAKLIFNTFTPNEFKYLLLICFFGFVLRLLFLIQIQDIPFFQDLYSDSKIYNQWAEEIVNEGKLYGERVFFMSPIYPYVLAVIKVFFDDAVFAIRLIQILIGTINVIIMFLIGRNLFTSTVGYITALLSAVYIVFIFYTSTILSETLQLFVVSLLILMLSKNPKNLNSKKWFIIGVLIGLAALFRANILIFYIPTIIWILFYYRKNNKWIFIRKIIVFFTLGLVLPIFPATLNNYLASGDFVLISSNGGINFYIGNNKDAIGIYQPPKDFDIFTDLSGERYAEKISGNNLSQSESSSFWYKKGFYYIFNDPLGFFLLQVNKTALFFSPNEYPQSFIMDIDFFKEQYSTILKFPLPGFGFILIFSIFGFVLTLKEKSKYSLLYIFTFCYIIATILFFITGRFRIALTPIFISFAAFGIIQIYSFIKIKRYKELIAGFFLVILYLISQKYLVKDYNLTSYDAYLNLGNIYFERGEYPEAYQSYLKSLKYKDYYLTHMMIGNFFKAQRNYSEAYRAYQNAIKRNPQSALTFFNLGTLYINVNEYENALVNFEKTIEIDPSFADSYRNIAIIYYMKADYKRSLAYFEKYLDQSNDEKIKSVVKKDVIEIKKRLRIN